LRIAVTAFYVKKHVCINPIYIVETQHVVLKTSFMAIGTICCMQIIKKVVLSK